MMPTSVDRVLGGPRSHSKLPRGFLNKRERIAFRSEQARVCNENTRQYAQLKTDVSRDVRYADMYQAMWSVMEYYLQFDEDNWDCRAVLRFFKAHCNRMRRGRYLEVYRVPRAGDGV